jgi:glyoxylase-like metal-dependent hydrolase (beta-lactamase superfamily II)
MLYKQNNKGEFTMQEIIRLDLDGVNCYLAKSAGNFILFDTAGHTILDKQFTNRRESLQKGLDQAGCTSENLKLVILTHGDNDHVTNATYIKQNYNTKIAMHAADLALVQNPTIDLVMKSFNYRSAIYKLVFKLMKNKIEKGTMKILKDFEKFTPDILIDETFNLSAYGFDGKIVHVPGHTAGSIGALMANGAFIAGDTFVNNSKPEIAPNALDFKVLNNSVDKLNLLDIETVYPGHGNPFDFKEIKY